MYGNVWYGLVTITKALHVLYRSATVHSSVRSVYTERSERLISAKGLELYEPTQRVICYDWIDGGGGAVGLWVRWKQWVRMTPGFYLGVVVAWS